MNFNKSGYINKKVFINVDRERIYLERCAKFLGIWFDVDLSFIKDCDYTRDRMRANSMFKFFNKVSRGIEVNTSLMLYKSLIRSIVDYGSYIFVPMRRNQRIKIERAQYMGLRTALGYRNSIPTNVIIAESKVMTIADRAGFLTRNTLAKIIAYGEPSTRNVVADYISKKRINTDIKFHGKHVPFSQTHGRIVGSTWTF